MNPTEADKPFLRKLKQFKRNCKNVIKIYQLFLILTDLVYKGFVSQEKQLDLITQKILFHV